MNGLRESPVWDDVINCVNVFWKITVSFNWAFFDADPALDALTWRIGLEKWLRCPTFNRYDSIDSLRWCWMLENKLQRGKDLPERFRFCFQILHQEDKSTTNWLFFLFGSAIIHRHKDFLFDTSVIFTRTMVSSMVTCWSPQVCGHQNADCCIIHATFLWAT